MIRATIASAVIGVAVLTTGCVSDDHPKQIPMSAIRVTEGDGLVSYTAASDGMAYVYDHGSDRIVWSGPVAQGQMVTVNPKDDKIMVGDRIAAENLLHTDHQHEIFFHAEAIPASDKVVIQKRQTIVEHPHDTVIQTPRGTVIERHHDTVVGPEDTVITPAR